MLADLILGHENMFKSWSEFSQKAKASFQDDDLNSTIDWLSG